jgi:Family of unknown function (DUF6069)
MTTYASPATRQPLSRQTRMAAVTLASAGCATGVWVVAARLAGVDLVVHSGSGTQTVTLASVLVVSVLASVVGGLSHRLAERWVRGPRVWTILAVTVLVLSLVGPAGAVTPAAAMSLAAMHLVVGLLVILGQSRRRAASAPAGGVA